MIGSALSSKALIPGTREPVGDCLTIFAHIFFATTRQPEEHETSSVMLDLPCRMDPTVGSVPKM